MLIETDMNAVFGFAASQALTKLKAANNGLRDQREAFNCKALDLMTYVFR